MKLLKLLFQIPIFFLSIPASAADAAVVAAAANGINTLLTYGLLHFLLMVIQF